MLCECLCDAKIQYMYIWCTNVMQNGTLICPPNMPQIHIEKEYADQLLYFVYTRPVLNPADQLILQLNGLLTRL